MFKPTFTFLLCIGIYPAASACAQSETARLPVFPEYIDYDREARYDRETGFAPQPIRLADGQEVTNPTILSPAQDLLPPYIATQQLYGLDYFEWCLRWNKLQDFLAKERAIPPQTIRGSVTTEEGYWESSSGGNPFRSSRAHGSYRSTIRSRQEVWRIGGYGGGPLNLYNPFVTR